MGRKLVTFGDSHSTERFPWKHAMSDLKVMGFSDFKNNYLGPRLLHTVLKTEPVIVDNRFCGEALKPFELKDGDFVVFCLGEIDIRCHAAVQALRQNKTMHQIGTELADRYVEWLRKCSDGIKGRDVTIVVQIPTPPWYHPVNWRDPERYSSQRDVEADSLPQVGSPADRLVAHSAFRSTLNCFAKSIPHVSVMDFTGEISSDFGYLLPKPVSDGTHLLIPEPVVNWFSRHLGVNSID